MRRKVGGERFRGRVRERGLNCTEGSNADGGEEAPAEHHAPHFERLVKGEAVDLGVAWEVSACDRRSGVAHPDDGGEEPVRDPLERCGVAAAPIQPRLNAGSFIAIELGKWTAGLLKGASHRSKASFSGSDTL